MLNRIGRHVVQFARQGGGLRSNTMTREHSDEEAAVAGDGTRPRQHAGAGLLAQVRDLPAREAHSARLEAALLDATRLLQGMHERLAPPNAEQRDMLGRCDALLARAPRPRAQGGRTSPGTACSRSSASGSRS
jgi:hypothetical protein